MKPRIKQGMFSPWLCFDDRSWCVGYGATPKEAYEDFVRINLPFIASYSKEDNQDQTRRET